MPQSQTARQTRGFHIARALCGTLVPEVSSTPSIIIALPLYLHQCGVEADFKKQTAVLSESLKVCGSRRRGGPRSHLLSPRPETHQKTKIHCATPRSLSSLQRCASKRAHKHTHTHLLVDRNGNIPAVASHKRFLGNILS